MGGAGLGRRFWTLCTAFTSANLGDGLTLVAFPLLAIQLTDDTRLIALVSAFRMLPFLTVGLPAGVVIDRFDRRKIAMLAQTLRAASLIVIALTVWADVASVTTVAIGAFIVGVGEVLTDGGLPAIVREVVTTDQLEVANGRLRISETVANNFIGPPIGALLFGLNSSLPFVAAAILYVVTVATLGFLRGSFTADDAGQHDAGFLAKIREGLAYVWKHPVLRPLALSVGLFSFFGAASNAVFVVLATDILGLTEFQYGLLITVSAVAAVLTTLVLMEIVNRTSHGTSMKISVATYAVHSILLGAVTFMPVIIFALVLGGISNPTWNVISSTIRQRLVEDRIFGRAMTAYLFIAWSLNPIGAMFGGLIAETYGADWVFIISGVAIGLLLVFAAPMFRRIDQALATQP